MYPRGERGVVCGQKLSPVDSPAHTTSGERIPRGLGKKTRNARARAKTRLVAFPGILDDLSFAGEIGADQCPVLAYASGYDFLAYASGYDFLAYASGYDFTA